MTPNICSKFFKRKKEMQYFSRFFSESWDNKKRFILSPWSGANMNKNNYLKSEGRRLLFLTSAPPFLIILFTHIVRTREKIRGQRKYISHEAEQAAAEERGTKKKEISSSAKKLTNFLHVPHTSYICTYIWLSINRINSRTNIFSSLGNILQGRFSLSLSLF